MSASCLMVGATAIALASPSFTLEWTHSVERVIWHEDWQIQDDALSLTGAAIKGSGAGMEPGADAILQNGWWVWTPDLPPQPSLALAASGATGGGWKLCPPMAPGADDGDCTELGQSAGEPLILHPCPNNRNNP